MTFLTLTDDQWNVIRFLCLYAEKKKVKGQPVRGYDGPNTLTYPEKGM